MIEIMLGWLFGIMIGAAIILSFDINPISCVLLGMGLSGLGAMIGSLIK